MSKGEGDEVVKFVRETNDYVPLAWLNIINLHIYPTNLLPWNNLILHVLKLLEPVV